MEVGAAEVTIREARPGDAEGIARVHVESWRTTYRGILPAAAIERRTCEDRRDLWVRRLNDPDETDFTFVAVTPEGEVVGWACGWKERDGDPVHTGELGGIYLLQAYQRQGIGRRLASHVARRLADQGHAAMLVWVLEANPARRFYESLGGRYLTSKPYEIAGASLIQVSYGWSDLHPLLREGTL